MGFRASLLILALGASVLTGCSRPPELVGVDNPAVPAESVPDVSKHRVFITTTRAASEVTGALFSSERTPELGLASVDVTVPPNHVVGELERPKRLPPDPRTEFAVVDPVIYRSDASFVAEVNRELATRPPGERRILLFIHG
jgi:esterase/lipase superfamily enzyme